MAFQRFGPDWPHRAEMKRVTVAIAAAAAGLYIDTTYATAALPKVEHTVQINYKFLGHTHIWRVSIGFVSVNYSCDVPDFISPEELEVIRHKAFSETKQRWSVINEI